MRSLFLNLLILLASVIVCFIAGELLLRLFSDPASSASFYTMDPQLGWALRPHVRAWQEKEGKALIEINSHGFRDREYDLKKSAGTVRIAVLGDSFTEAMQVGRENTFLAVSERKLADCPAYKDQSVQVMNFGVTGYGTAQELLTLRHRVWNYDPDMVVLAFFAANDVYDNHPRLNPTNPELAPYFVLDKDSNDLILKNSLEDKSPPKKALFAMKKFWVDIKPYSRLLELVSRKVSIVESASEEQKAHWESKLGSDYLEWLAATPPKIPEMKEAWEVTERLILRTYRDTRRKNTPFLLLILSTAIQAHPDSGLRREYLRRFRLPSLYYPDNRLIDYANKNGIPVLSLARPLLAYAEEKNVLLHGFKNLTPGFGHWNEEGHKVAGELLAQEICRRAVEEE